jgi:hypothetical protein
MQMAAVFGSIFGAIQQSGEQIFPDPNTRPNIHIFISELSNSNMKHLKCILD